MVSNPSATATGQAFGTSGYRNYVLFSLTLLYTLNFIDRVLIGVVAEPIINEFGLSDTQFGLLSGFGFALMYTLMGIPIARLSENYSRVRIIAAGVILWSVMTALCGFSVGFISLLVFRIGVGVGEACLTPPANSMIADYYPMGGRAKALAIFATGITLGSVLANGFGGPIADAFSWRQAFIILGVPGILFGLIFLFTAKEPPRGYSDPPGTKRPERASMMDTLKQVGTKPTYWINAAAAAIVAFVGYGMINFQGSYFIRTHGLSVSEAALQISVPVGLASTFGTFFAGYLTDRLSRRFPTAVAWIPGISLILSVPFFWIGFSTESISVALAVLICGVTLQYSYLGAQFTICQSVASANCRATAIAIFLFIINIIGYGLGPLFIGYLSDIFMSNQLAASPFAGELTTAICKGKPAELISQFGQQKADICMQASASGLGQALGGTVTILAIAGILYLVICRYLDRDLATKPA